LAIVTLVLWVVTAAAGVSLLGTGGAARRAARAASSQHADGSPDGMQDAGASMAGAHSSLQPTETLAQTAHAIATARFAAVPLTAEGKPPPVPRVRVETAPGEHPLLEFAHPALALTGLACWFMFVFVHYRPLAWIAFGILVGAIGLGLTWLTANQRAVRERVSAAWPFPPKLALTHGLAAAVSVTLTVLTALTASHG
jgi:hypothetical protein